MTVEMPRAFVRLKGGPLVDRYKAEWGQSDCLFPWRTKWPPPERITLAVSKVLGAFTLIEREKLDDETLFQVERSMDTAEYVRVSFSKLTDEQMATATHIVRGAEYELATDQGGS